jgi:putative phosphoesterase
MKLAFISDIHGNYHALKEVFKQIKKLDIKKIYCLGDIVNYYYDPDKCIDLLIKNKVKCIKGNHEKILLSSLKKKELRNFFAERYGNSIHINLKKIKKRHLNFIKSLPSRMNIRIGKKKTIIAHGAPWKNDFYFYKNTKKKWINKIKKYDKEIFILGHTHHPMNLRLSNKKIIINPGSIGQPRNNSKKACWLMINDENMKFDFIETKYSLTNLIRSIKKNDNSNKRLLKYFI